MDGDLISDGLYGDLNTDAESFQAAEYRAKYKTELDRATSLTARVSTLEAENARLRSENEIFERNISCLFKTAQLEIKRKVNEIQRLRNELARQQLPRGTKQGTSCDAVRDSDSDGRKSRRRRGGGSTGSQDEGCHGGQRGQDRGKAEDARARQSTLNCDVDRPRRRHRRSRSR